MGILISRIENNIPPENNLKCSKENMFSRNSEKAKENKGLRGVKMKISTLFSLFTKYALFSFLHENEWNFRILAFY